jgi:hypothetical protein
MSEALPITVRAGCVGDEGFVIQTWLKSYRKGSEFARKVHPRVFFEFHHPLVEAIWRRPTTRSYVACDPAAEAVIYGYLIVEHLPRETFERWGKIEPRPIVHYVYVKEAFQRLHVATRLIEASGVDPFRIYLSHHTRDKSDMNPHSPRYGQVRWRGAETLLQKWPLAHEEAIADSRGQKQYTYREGNLYVPYFNFIDWSE